MMDADDFATVVLMVSFTFMIVLIMLNMLLSIILDTYMVVKGETEGKAETLISQTVESFSRWRAKKKGEALGLADVRAHLMRQARGRFLPGCTGNGLLTGLTGNPTDFHQVLSKRVLHMHECCIHGQDHALYDET